VNAVSDEDDDVNRLRIALGRISRLVDRQVSGDGLTRTQLAVLGTVARAKSMRMSELAELEGLNPTMLSRVVGKLESLELLRRAPGSDDRRSVVVEITPGGTRLHTKLRKQRTQLFAQRLTELPRAEVTALLGAVPALESLAEAMRTEPARTGALR
jgi:DNA-binding MarR family transcriptional regulator